MRRAAAHLSQANVPGHDLAPRPRAAAAGAPIRVLAVEAFRVLTLSRQGYYKSLNDPVSQRD